MMIWSPGTWLRVSGLALAALLLSATLEAQQAPPPAKSPPAKDAPPGPETGLQRRVEQIEEQLVDLQVVIGTLESLARGVNPPPAGGGPGGALSAADAGRLDAMETQIKAIAAQLESLQEQVRGLADRKDGPPPADFGAVTVAPAKPKDELDRVFPPPPSGPPPKVVPPPPPSPKAEAERQPQQLFEQAYGYLLQKDYATAEVRFENFLKRHPTHTLAGHAQYWLGETFFIRGQFQPAAAAFLKGVKEYGESQKAPDSLLKLAMSLHRMGHKDAACSSFSELATKFPTPPAHVKGLAQAERKRSGC